MYLPSLKRKAPCLCAVSLLAFVLTGCGGGGGGNDDSPPPNQPPVVRAGDDFDAVELGTITLESASSDPDGTIAAWSWEQVAGPAVTLSGADAQMAVFTAPAVTDVTELEFTLSVTDDGGDTASDTVQATVHPNEPPEIAVDFPCNGCRLFGEAISVTGTVNPGADVGYAASVDGIDTVTVDAGGQLVDALVQTDGRWIAQNVPLPADSTTLSLSAIANDLNGESDSVVLDMQYGPTLASALLAHDPVTPNRGYLLDLGITADQLFSIDFTTNLLTTIREFDSLYFGSVTAIDIDASGSRFFINERPGTISVVDLTTGETSILSDSDTGTGPELIQSVLMAFDADDDRLIVYDAYLEALFTIDATTGARVIVSDAGHGSGNPFSAPEHLALDSANNFAYLSETLGNFIAVDLGTGDRSVLPKVGASIVTVRGMDFDPARAGIAVIDADDQVFFVNAATGIRTIKSAGANHPGFELGQFPWQLTYDALADRYVISDFSTKVSDTDRLIAIDPDSGTRSVLYDNRLGTGTVAYGPGHLALDAAGQQIYLSASSTANIVRVDLTTGERHLVTDSTTGSGPAIGVPGDIALDLPGNRAFVIDGLNSTLVAVALDSGNRTILASDLIGTGPALSSPAGLEADLANERVYVLDHGIPAILAVELASGERTIVSDASNSGPELVEFYGALLDADNNRLIITDIGNGASVAGRLVAVDLATGDRTTLAGVDTGNGPLLDVPGSIARADEPNRVIVTSFGRFYLVDLETGNRQVIADQDTGNGEVPFNSHDVVYDSEKHVFYSWDSTYEALFQYDMTTGDRVTVSR